VEINYKNKNVLGSSIGKSSTDYEECTSRKFYNKRYKDIMEQDVGVLGIKILVNPYERTVSLTKFYSYPSLVQIP
jgi:hypothetical protein